MSWPTAARLHEAFEALRAYVDDVAVRLDGRLAGAETTLRRHDCAPRADSLRRLQRAVRTPVGLDRAARRRAARESCSLASIIATRHAFTPSRSRAARANSSSRRRRPRRCASRSPGPPMGRRAMNAPPEPTLGSRSRRLPRPRGHFQRGGAAGERCAGHDRAGRAGQHLRHGHRAAPRRGRLVARSDRELARGLDQRHARPARRRGERRHDRRRGAAAR